MTVYQWTNAAIAIAAFLLGWWLLRLSFIARPVSRKGQAYLVCGAICFLVGAVATWRLGATITGPQ